MLPKHSDLVSENNLPYEGKDSPWRHGSRTWTGNIQDGPSVCYSATSEGAKDSEPMLADFHQCRRRQFENQKVYSRITETH